MFRRFFVVFFIFFLFLSHENRAGVIRDETFNINGLASLDAEPDAGDYMPVYDVSAASQKKVLFSDVISGVTSGLAAGNGIIISGNTISTKINSTNLKFTSTEINTIQDIAITSSPSFAGMFTNSIDQLGINRLEIGANSTDQIFMGKSGVGSRIFGNTQFDTTSFDLNAGGGANSATGVGYNILENGSLEGYFKTGSRTGFIMKAPGKSADFHFNPGNGVGFATKINSADLTADRNFTIPDADSNPVQPSSAGSNQFATGISSVGVISYAQPSASNLSDGTTGTGAVVLQTSPTINNPIISYLDSSKTNSIGSPYTVLTTDSGTRFNNTGATAKVGFALTATANIENTYIVSDADGLRITMAAGDTLAIGSTITAAGGYFESTTLGSMLIVKCIDSTACYAISSGTWTPGP